MPGELTVVKSVRFSLEDKRWLQAQAIAEDRPLGYVVRKIVRDARMADCETTEQKEGDED